MVNYLVFGAKKVLQGVWLVVTIAACFVAWGIVLCSQESKGHGEDGARWAGSSAACSVQASGEDIDG